MEFLVPYLVAFIGGSALTKVIEIVADRWKGATERRRSEVDRMARQLRAAQRREHLAILWGRRLEIIAVSYGVPESEMPVLDFKDHD